MYSRLSTEKPYLTASVTATAVLSMSDLFCQFAEQKFIKKTEHHSWDWRRTMSLAAFGCLYYGGPLKFIYLAYDRMTLGIGKKTFIDVCLHTPFLMLPSYYMLTEPIKGQTLPDAFSKLRSQWVESSVGSVCFWLPAVAFNFRFVPQHSRVLVTAGFSFIHKSWLSYISNRKIPATVSRAMAVT